MNKKIADVMPIRKGRVNPAYGLRSQSITQRREHLKLLGIKRVSKNLSLAEGLAEPSNDDAATEAAPQSTEGEDAEVSEQPAVQPIVILIGNEGDNGDDDPNPSGNGVDQSTLSREE